MRECQDGSAMIKRRCGYTLLELMVVLSIITIFAAVSFPMLMKPLRKSHVQQAAQDVAEALMTARVWAMEHGEIYAFVYAVDGSEFELKPLTKQLAVESDNASISSPAVLDSSTDLAFAGSDSFESPAIKDDETDKEAAVRFPLPEINSEVVNDVTFSLAASQSDENILFTDVSDSAVESAGVPDPKIVAADGLDVDASGDVRDGDIPVVSWSQPILFYPDGRSNNDSIRLVGSDGHRIEVVVRGLTGSVSIGQMEKVVADPPTEVRSSTKFGVERT